MDAGGVESDGDFCCRFLKKYSGKSVGFDGGDDDCVNEVCVEIDALDEFSIRIAWLLGLIAFFMAVAADVKSCEYLLRL